MNLLLPIEKLRSVGPRNVSRLRKLGIKTVKDLLWHFPARYEDYAETTPITDIEPGEKVHIQGEILSISTRKIFPRRMFVTNAMVQDSTGAVKIVWFNQPYIENQLSEGSLVSLAGKANLNKHGLYISSPVYEKIGFSNQPLKHTDGLVPIYHETEGVTSKYLRFLIQPLLKDIEVADALPDYILEKYSFPGIFEALNAIHRPEKEDDADKAKQRFAFEDLLLFQIKSLLERRRLNQLKSIPILFDVDVVKKFIQDLPFILTKDQKIAAWEILKDLEKKYPMNRLLEGDVGSGKTVVALLAAFQTGIAGAQTVFLAPTEVLAHQHYNTVSGLIKGSGLNIGLLTASVAKLNGENIKKPELKKEIANGTVKILIGTHAIIQKDVLFNNLALVVIDEQHRFGVNQRAALIKNENADKVPHLLSMTATPIPRTLALTIYGDLDISLIKEKPKNRQETITRIVTPSKRREAYTFIKTEVKKKRQVFVVCPRIEISDPKKEIKGSNKQSKMNILWQEVKAVEEEYKKLSEDIFPELNVVMLHGKMKPAEKNRIMEGFKNGESDILVATSVIEVGVDIPNATIMMIESAERFGLAQLHQFRGRVGRDIHQSYCLLLSSTSDRTVNKRLKALVDCDDGFELAEKDMAIRGPGEFFGVKQSGLPDLAMASLSNVDLIKKSRAEARLLLKEDPGLKKYPQLKERLEQLQRMVHFE